MIKCRRKVLKLRQEDLAAKINISRSYLSAIENKKVLNINLKYLISLSEALNVDIRKLLKWFLDR
ncbi:helix-turn-helix domain-containing protein [Romboutsia lituseburensis]|uniref:helix-turn-helix domain-containing protein n=1 Tax=Romboutsia lituseburensis TaxID=1537 RepID=UPI0022EA3D6F|nr:helix-turn-helix transcriptional regulator [Romboutsia lituseburensis]